MFGALLILGLVMAVITSWMLDKYDTAWHPKRSVLQPADGDGSKGSAPPFPGGELKNLFWFIQVTRSAMVSAVLHVDKSGKKTFTLVFVLYTV